MKFSLASVLGSAALVFLSSGTASADLTPHRTTYDLFTVFLRKHLAVLGDAVVQNGTAPLVMKYQDLLRSVDRDVSADAITRERFVGYVNKFYEDSEWLQGGRVDVLSTAAEKLPTTAHEMLYAPREFSDVVFDAAENATSGLDNADATRWVLSWRMDTEADVINGVHPMKLAVNMAATVHWFGVDEYISTLEDGVFAAAFKEARDGALEQMTKEFGYSPEIEISSEAEIVEDSSE